MCVNVTAPYLIQRYGDYGCHGRTTAETQDSEALLVTSLLPPLGAYDWHEVLERVRLLSKTNDFGAFV